MRNKKGVTLIVLIIVIIVMLIIFGVTIVSGTDLLKNAEKSRLVTNLYAIKARAGTLLEDYLFDGTDNLGEEADSSLVARAGWEYTSQYEYRMWSVARLKEEGIDTENVSANENFIIQYDLQNNRVNVASSKGYKDLDGNYYYVLTDLD